MKPKPPKKRDPKPKAGKKLKVIKTPKEYTVVIPKEAFDKTVKDFFGLVTQNPFNIKNDEEWKDMFLYGFFARDQNGKRVDPSKIRKKVNGGYVIIE
jgi:hypothetical protein